MRSSPLFSAVVLAGAALTQMTQSACGDETTTPTAGDASSTTSSSSSGSTGSTGSTDGGSTTTDTGSNPPSDAETCPDGSERPVPPCNFIK